MTNALKGVLLSGLVYPGLGQIILKHYLRGAVLLLGVSVGLLVLIVKAVQQAITVLERIGLEGGAITMSTISKAANESVSNSESLILKFFFVFIICCWIIGVVDAYRIGREKDIEDMALPPKVEPDWIL